jgi:phage gpG-like protein
MALKTYKTNGVSVKYDDNALGVLAALKRATARGLDVCGAVAESYAKKELSKPKLHADGSVRPNVITGRLRNSIAHKVRENKVYIGTNVEYAPTVEFGTRKSEKTWAYPFLKPAALDHGNEYKEILKNSLKNA